jgi:4'-phosphopantetheinyl transferase
MLPESDVHVWLVPVGVPAESLADLQSVLDDDEGERARRFRTGAARERFVVSHGVLRFVLGGLTGSPPERLRFARRCGWCGGTDHGKPRLSDADRSGIDFSLSHSNGLALIAVARGRLVGADVERVRRRTDILAVARSAFSPAERRAIESPATDGERREAFFRCWTRKEAYLKACGEGLAGGLDTEPGDTGDWQIRSLRAPPGYMAAVAAQGQFALRQRTTLCPPKPKLLESPTAPRPLRVRSPSARAPSAT